MRKISLNEIVEKIGLENLERVEQFFVERYFCEHCFKPAIRGNVDRLGLELSFRAASQWGANKGKGGTLPKLAVTGVINLPTGPNTAPEKYFLSLVLESQAALTEEPKNG